MLAPVAYPALSFGRAGSGYLRAMTNPDRGIPTDDQDDESGGQVSSAGSGSLQAETSYGGADSVPDTPDDVPAPSAADS